MKVVYLIQTHRNPEQIYRLVETLSRSSADCRILISHNDFEVRLDQAILERFSVLGLRHNRVYRGDFSIVQGYLDALEWMFERDIAFDWFSNISGQDYPTQKLSDIHCFLANTEFDGFLEYCDALADDNPWGASRYLYQYRHLMRGLPQWTLSMTRYPRNVAANASKVINQMQPLFRLMTLPGLMLGVRSSEPPFSAHFKCYGGSYFMTLSRSVVAYVYEFAKQSPALVDYYRATLNPAESFIQSVVANSGRFTLCNDSKRFVDWGSGDAKLLTADDYPRLVAGDFHFARKFDMEQDATVLDLLDELILGEGNG